jgi:hypothetical protein
LQREGQLPDFIKKNRAEVRVFEAARLCAVGSGESPPFVPEELGFKQIFGDGGAVDLDERVGLAVG